MFEKFFFWQLDGVDLLRTESLEAGIVGASRGAHETGAARVLTMMGVECQWPGVALGDRKPWCSGGQCQSSHKFSICGWTI